MSTLLRHRRAVDDEVQSPDVVDVKKVQEDFFVVGWFGERPVARTQECCYTCVEIGNISSRETGSISRMSSFGR